MAVSEEKLLNMLLDEATSEGERVNAVRALKRLHGVDRDGLVKKYTTSGGTSGSTSNGDFDLRMEMSNLRLELAGLRVKIALKDAEIASKNTEIALKDVELGCVKKQMAGIGGMLQEARRDLQKAHWDLRRVDGEANKLRSELATVAAERDRIQANYHREVIAPALRKRRSYNTARRVKHVKQACEHCGGMFKPTRSDAKTCSPKCRQAMYQARQFSDGYREAPRSSPSYGHNNQQNQRDADHAQRLSGRPRLDVEVRP
jgi:hypothetical protein